jgi:hypothetical protein
VATRVDQAGFDRLFLADLNKHYFGLFWVGRRVITGPWYNANTNKENGDIGNWPDDRNNKNLADDKMMMSTAGCLYR